MSAQNYGTDQDSVWCEHLNEFIKCASLDLMTDRVADTHNDTTFIEAFTPKLRLALNQTELLAKQYGKVTYTAFLSTDKNMEVSKQNFYKVYKKLNACLPFWEQTKLKNANPSLSAIDDYFFTNSEDETSVRLDLFITDSLLHVRLRIY